MYIIDTYNSRVRKVTITTSYPRSALHTSISPLVTYLFFLILVWILQRRPVPRFQHRFPGKALAATHHQRLSYFLKLSSLSPTLVPSTSTPSTATPSSSYPSLSPSTAFIISTIAGTGSGSYSGDNGAATAAGVNNPVGITLDATGNISLCCDGIYSYFYHFARQFVRRWNL